MQEIIATKDRVLIMGHRLPDADAIGAAVGISCIARAMDKKAHIVINESMASVKPLLELSGIRASMGMILSSTVPRH